MKNLRQFISALRERNEIVDVFHPVDPHLEIAEIHRRVAACDGPALFFHKVKGSSFPVTTNLFGSSKRLEIAFQHKPEKFVQDLVDFATKEFPPSLSTLWKKRDLLKGLLRIGTKRTKRLPVQERESYDLETLPLLKCWPQDGGSFITLPLVYTESPHGGAPNLGMYRIQRYGAKKTGLHFQIAKGGGFHYHLAEEKNVDLPVHIFVGGPPALILSAITPLPENVSELLVASLLQGTKLSTSSHASYPLLAECEFAITGKAKPLERHPEGPFGDHYGYYSWTHDFPVFHLDKIYHRKDAIYPATVVGKPRQEDFYIGEYLQKLLSPLFPIVMPGVKEIWSYGEAGFHSIASAIVRERYHRECMASAFRILGEGQLALTKTLFLTDQPCNLQNFYETLTTILERFKPETDLFVFANLSMDTLDYTGPALNKGSRAVFLGLGEKVRDLPEVYEGLLPAPLEAAAPFCPGCLVVQTPSYTKFQEFSHLFKHFEKWPLVILVDDLKKTLQSPTAFLWTVFTRFEPAADIHAKVEVKRHHLCYKAPLLIDARMKPSYPPELLTDPDTEKLVTQNWKNYFPQGQEMGDSNSAHLANLY